MKIRKQSARHPYLSALNWAGTWFLSTVHLGIYISMVIIAIILLNLFIAIVTNLYWGMKGFQQSKEAASKQGWCVFERVRWMHDVISIPLYCSSSIINLRIWFCILRLLSFQACVHECVLVL